MFVINDIAMFCFAILKTNEINCVETEGRGEGGSATISIGTLQYTILLDIYQVDEIF